MPKIEVFSQTRTGQRGGPHENEFWLFSNVKVNVISSYLFPSWVMVRKLSKKVHFLQFCADLNKKYKSVNTIYLYASHYTYYTLSENFMIISWVTVYEMLMLKISEKMLTQQNFNKILRLQTSETASHSIINNTIFWKGVARPFRCTYVSRFFRLEFCAEFSTKLQKMHFVRQFEDHNSGREHGN